MGSGYSNIGQLDDNDVILAQTQREQVSSAGGNAAGTSAAAFSSSFSSSSSRRPLLVRPAVHLDSINWLSPVRPEMVVSCSSDKTIVLNNMDTGACLTRWRGHEREVSKVLYKHVGCRHFLLSGSKDATVRLWHFNSPDCCQVFRGHQLGVTGIAALDETRFVSGGRDGRLCLWDSNVEEKPIRTVSSSQNLITHLELDPEGRLLCQTAEDGTLRLWDAHNLCPVDQIVPSAAAGSGHSLWHCSICPAEPNYCLTSAGGSLGDGCEVGLWDIRQRRRIQQFRGHERDVRSAILLNQQQVTWKRLILSVSTDRTAKLWDLNTGRCIWTENLAAELNSCLGFSDGSVVIAGGNATLYDLRLLMRAGRPFLQCNSVQFGNNESS